MTVKNLTHRNYLPAKGLVERRNTINGLIYLLGGKWCNRNHTSYYHSLSCTWQGIELTSWFSSCSGEKAWMKVGNISWNIDVGRDLLRLYRPTSLFKYSQINHVAQDHVQSGFEYLCGRRLWIFSGQYWEESYSSFIPFHQVHTDKIPPESSLLQAGEYISYSLYLFHSKHNEIQSYLICYPLALTICRNDKANITTSVAFEDKFVHFPFLSTSSPFKNINSRWMLLKATFH